MPFWTLEPQLTSWSLAYAKARNFDIRPVTNLSDRFINLKLVARFRSTVSSYVKYNLQIPENASHDSDLVTLIAKDDTQFG